MSTDPTNNTDDDIIIDELASRLVDRDIDLADIPSELRVVVESRAARFVTNRQQLLTSLPQADGSTIDRAINEAINEALRNNQIQAVSQVKSRKFGVYIGALAAAAAVVAIIGVATTQSGSSDESVSDMAVASKISPEEAAVPMASEAPAEMAADSFAPMAADSTLSGAKASFIINDTNELQDLVSQWSVEGFVIPQKSEQLCDDPLRPAIDIEATFAGEPAEIHFTPQDGVFVYRVSDCSVIIGIVP
ncbi:MAG: hypothetical protein NWP39_03000 [Ilumatobacteraceae bacterium]|jgi:hypothetical protein|nr:hypothetical protein [Ilumatobacteraceae bacterium]MDP4705553.1 hypothetical protein [Ilumatobacteraceae bacterium]MDP5114434.1 hypothetical protein [Ilumatobacteraceae bacterium]